MTKIYEVVVEKPKITSPFGYRIDPISKNKKYHAGLDLISKVKNRNLYAIDEGYVQKVVTGQNKSKTGYGNYIWIRYPRYNLSLLHAHCEKILLKKGAKVKKGDVVAIMGTTGKSTGVPANYDILTDKYNLTRTLKKGSKGNDVKELQKELQKRGYDLGKYGVDGVFGTKNSYTSKAVKNFQNDNGLKDDEIVGKNTAHKLGWLYKGK